MNDDFAHLDQWLESYAARLKPAERKRLMTAILRELRRAQAQRMAANVQPDGSKMEPRKPRRERVKRGRAMFPRLRLARNLKIRADADEGEIGFAPNVSRVAAEHHYGADVRVGRTKDGREIRTRYPARELLGFGPDDLKRTMDAAIDHLAK